MATTPKKTGNYKSKATGEVRSYATGLAVKPAPATKKASVPVSSAFTTNDSNLDGLMQAVETALRNQISGGNVLNKDIEITPEKMQEFMDQAAREIDPYYTSQYKVVRDSLLANLTDLQATQKRNFAAQDETFGNNIRTSQNNMAESGQAISGERVRTEGQQVDAFQRATDSATQAAQTAARNAVQSAEQQVGSANLKGAGFTTQDINAPDYAGFKPGESFIQGFSSTKKASPLFSLSDNTIGSLEEEQKKAKLLRQKELEAAYREKEARNIYN